MLRSLFESAAAELDAAKAVTAPDGEVAWSRGADLFAVLGAGGEAAEFRLDTAVAAAAVRTPDTAPSSRGSGWVLFRPAPLDGHAVDRATAWFVSAYRRAAGG